MLTAVGHGGPGTLPQHQQALLPLGKLRHPMLRHHLGGLIPSHALLVRTVRDPVRSLLILQAT